MVDALKYCETIFSNLLSAGLSARPCKYKDEKDPVQGEKVCWLDADEVMKLQA